MKFRLLILCLSSFLVLALNANAAGIADSHMKKSIPCTSCHKTMKGGDDVERTDCLKCHNEEQLKVAGEKIKPKFDNLNPHKPHFEDLACSECHKGHAEQVNFCASCHGNR